MPIEPFGGIADAIAELCHPEVVWFRGHVRQHRLLPALFRFPRGSEHERLLMERCRLRSSDAGQEEGASYLHALMTMHDRYVPTRLLAWTERLYVALFCAFVRESDGATIFVLDPVRLNALSGADGVVEVSARNGPDASSREAWQGEAALPERPLAVAWRSRSQDRSGRETVFTAHGRNALPLERQCPDCVRKVVLSKEERVIGMQAVMSSALTL